MENSETAQKPTITKKRSKKTLTESGKTAVKAAAKTPAKTASKAKKATSILFTDEARREMIATAAYFRAQQRGFQGGSPVDDWLVAETEIDSQIRARQ